MTAADVYENSTSVSGAWSAGLLRRVWRLQRRLQTKPNHCYFWSAVEA